MRDGRWSFVDPATQGIIARAVRGSRAEWWPDVLEYVFSHVKPGNRLKLTEAEWLLGWLEDTGRDVEMEDVLTVQLNHASLMEMFDGHKEAVRRVTTALQVSGLLTLVHSGIRGHSALYAVEPVPGGSE